MHQSWPSTEKNTTIFKSNWSENSRVLVSTFTFSQIKPDPHCGFCCPLITNCRIGGWSEPTYTTHDFKIYISQKRLHGNSHLTSDSVQVNLKSVGEAQIPTRYSLPPRLPSVHPLSKISKSRGDELWLLFLSFTRQEKKKNWKSHNLLFSSWA